jgi:hypothetical protein
MSKVALSGNASGTGTFTIASPNSNTDRTLTLPDNTGTVVTTGSTAAVTQAMLAAGVAGNGPAFRAFLVNNQALSNTVDTKITLSAESFDTTSCFNNTGSTVGGIPAYAFLPNVAGYYQITANVGANATSGLTYNYIQIRRNGANTAFSIYPPYATTTQYGSCSALVFLNGTTDYIELFVQVSGSGSLIALGGDPSTFLSGFLARALG